MLKTMGPFVWSHTLPASGAVQAEQQDVLWIVKVGSRLFLFRRRRLEGRIKRDGSGAKEGIGDRWIARVGSSDLPEVVREGMAGRDGVPTAVTGD